MQVWLQVQSHQDLCHLHPCSSCQAVRLVWVTRVTVLVLPPPHTPHAPSPIIPTSDWHSPFSPALISANGWVQRWGGAAGLCAPDSLGLAAMTRCWPSRPVPAAAATGAFCGRCQQEGSSLAGSQRPHECKDLACCPSSELQDACARLPWLWAAGAAK